MKYEIFVEKFEDRLFCLQKELSEIIVSDVLFCEKEFVSKFAIERRGLPAIALTTDSSILTAVSNDLGYENIFVRQIQTLAKQGDVFIAISTSGTSPNIVNAVNTAKSSNIYTIGLTGKTAAPIDKICDCIIKVPSDNVPVIQECHIMIEHIICDIVEKVIFNS